MPSEQAAKLRAVGLDIQDAEFLTPAVVAAAYVNRYHPGAAVLAFGNEGLLQPLRAGGIRLVDNPGHGGRGADRRRP